MKVYIKNMVSLRCKMVVKATLDQFNLGFSYVELGEVQLLTPLLPNQRKQLQTVLAQSGLELLDDKNAITVERIKNAIVEMVHYTDVMPSENVSVYLSQRLGIDYHKLSDLFSKTKGMTIEHYVILHKIERVKELIIYDQLSLTEISYLLHYSSVAHLSNQFKKITGLTPTYFKSIKGIKRSPLENL